METQSVMVLAESPKAAPTHGSRARLTLFMMEGLPDPHADWLHALRRVADCDVRPWPPFGTTRFKGFVAERGPSPRVTRGGLAPGVKRRICETIDDGLNKNWPLIDLAEIADLSTCHFARAFKQSLGMSPHRYIVGRRVAAAARLVPSTNRCLSDIALEVGFSDQSHFTRTFAKRMGETPSEFRRRHR